MKTAVVTGAASGMGKEFAICLSGPGYDLDELWLFDLNREALEKTAASLPVKTRLFVMDISKEEALAEIKQAFEREKPEICMLVNCAGFGTIGWFSETDMQRQLAMIDVNCKALTGMTYLSIPYLMRGGAVINMSSGAAFMPQPRFAVYAASKAYVLSFSRGAGRVLKRKGVSVCAVCPGPVKTNFYRTAVKKKDLEKETRDLKMQGSKEVVKIALRDVKRGREVCYPSGSMLFSAILTKVMPTSALLSFVMKFSVRKYGISDSV